MNSKNNKFKNILIVTSLIFILQVTISCSTPVETTRGYIDERNKPIIAYTGPTRSGSTIYEESCATCHDRTTQGAPLPNDDIEWARRLKKGKNILLKHVMEGYKELMPIKGGCRNCTEQEVQAAIDYILFTSGVVNNQTLQN